MIAGLAFYLFAAVLLGAALGVVWAKNTVHSVLFLILAFFNAAALFIMLGAEFLAMLLVIVYVGAVAVLFLFVVMMLDIGPDRGRSISLRNRLMRLKESALEAFRFKLAFIPLFLALVYLGSSTDILLQKSGHTPFLYNGLPVSFVSPFVDLNISKTVLSLSWIMTIFSFFISFHVARRLSGVYIIDTARRFYAMLPMSFLVGLLLAGEFFVLALYWQTSPYVAQVVSSPMPPSDLVTNTQALATLIYRYYAYIFQACGLILLVAMIGAIVLSLKKKTSLKRQNIEDQINRDPKKCIEMTRPRLGEGVSDV